MGSPEHEPRRSDDEGPQRQVTVAPFAISVYEVTFYEWDTCVADGYCGGYPPRDRDWGRGKRPVINESWDDITTHRGFLAWLNSKTDGTSYRLPSEAEWEYAARGGTTTPFWTGLSISTDQANFERSAADSGSSKAQYRRKTAPVGSFAANAFGLHDVHGNVWEWIQDCWNDSYHGAPSDGSTWMTGDCTFAVIRGGSWNFDQAGLRSANRGRVARLSRDNFFGFRVARSLPP